MSLTENEKMEFTILATTAGVFTIAALAVAGIIGFIIGTGNASLFIPRRDYWAKSPVENLGQGFKTGCITAIIFIIIAGWLIVKIFE